MGVASKILKLFGKGKESSTSTQEELAPCPCGKMPKYEIEKTKYKVYATLRCEDCHCQGTSSIEINHIKTFQSESDITALLWNEAVDSFNREVRWRRIRTMQDAKSDKLIESLVTKAKAEGLEPK